MRMEKAVVNMVEAAHQKDIAPERLARIFEVALDKVASINPVGTQALKIVQTNLIKDLLRNELNVVVRMSRLPRKPRTQARDGLTKILREEVEDLPVVKKSRGRRKLLNVE